MIVNEEKFLESFDRDGQEELLRAVKTVQRFGLFRFFVEQNKQRIADSFETAEEATLVKQIRELRQENRVLVTLDSLYHRINEGIPDAPQS